MTTQIKKYVLSCQRCGNEFNAARPQARYCCDRCRKAACEDRNRGACDVCGGPMAVGTAWGSRNHHRRRRCADCRRKEETARSEALAAQYEALWAEGKTLKEIAAAMGLKDEYSAGAVIAMYRAEGRNFAFRRSGQALKNLQANTWGRGSKAA